MKKIEKKTKEELRETEELCCSDSNVCSLDCRPVRRISDKSEGFQTSQKDLTVAVVVAANEKRALPFEKCESQERWIFPVDRSRAIDI
jgi:hypothetical protein